MRLTISYSTLVNDLTRFVDDNNKVILDMCTLVNASSEEIVSINFAVLYSDEF